MDVIDRSTGEPIDIGDEPPENGTAKRLVRTTELVRVPEAFEAWRARGRAGVSRRRRSGCLDDGPVWR